MERVFHNVGTHELVNARVRVKITLLHTYVTSQRGGGGEGTSSEVKAALQW